MWSGGVVTLNLMGGNTSIAVNRLGNLTLMGVRNGCARIFLSLLRYSSLFADLVLCDVSGIACSGSVDKWSIYAVFYSRRWSMRLCLGWVAGSAGSSAAISDFWGGATWPEREFAEATGVSFFNKRDCRRLMLDYNLVGYPLTKQFAACGYEEIEYSHYTGSLIYRPLRLRDNISVWQH